MIRPEPLHRPCARAVRRTGLGLLVGVLSGWVVGLLKPPRGNGQQP